jgi:hypothetical protein
MGTVKMVMRALGSILVMVSVLTGCSTTPTTAKPAAETSLMLVNATDADLASLRDRPDVKSLCLAGRHGTENELAYLKEMQGLRTLYLCGSGWSAATLANLKDLKGLQLLDLSYSDVTDAGLACVKEIKGLQRVVLDHSSVTEAGGDDLQAALPNIEIIR